jgi:hypothetical protein
VFKLTVVSVEQGWGTCSRDPEPDWQGNYVFSATVIVTAVPASGYVFDHWEGSGTFSGDVATVFMDSDKLVTAFFTPSDSRHVISVSVSSPESGTVSLTPSQPDDGYPVNTLVNVVAHAAPGYSFGRWQGALQGTSSQASILMDGNKSITAVFDPGLTTACDPLSGGTLALEPPPASGYPPGTEVTITATAAAGYRFHHWSGDVSGPGNGATMTITVDAPKTVTAHFVEKSDSFPWWSIPVIIVIMIIGVILLRLFWVLVVRRQRYTVE